MFRKLVANLPFSPSLINQLGYYSKRLGREEFTRRIGLVFMVLTMVVQSMTYITPAQASNQGNLNDIIFAGAWKANLLEILRGSGCDSKGRCDIKQIFAHYGINDTNLEAGTYKTIYSSVANGYWSLGRYPRGYGGEKPVRIGNSTYYLRTLAGWSVRNWQVIEVQTDQGTRWIIPDCGNIVVRPSDPVPQPNFEVSKAVTKAGAGAWAQEVKLNYGDSVNYQITVKNTGNTELKHIIIKDTLPQGATYVPTSLRLNGQVIPEVLFDPGIDMFSLMPGQTTVVHYSAKINDKAAEACQSARLRNVATAQPTGLNIKEADAYVVADCLPTHPDFTLQKDVKKEGGDKFAQSVELKYGDTVEYRINVTNSGDVALKNTVVKDKLPAGVEFIQGSVRINDQKVDADLFTTGVTIPDIAVGASAAITFKAKLAQGKPEECQTKSFKNVATAQPTGLNIKEDDADITAGCNEKVEETCPIPGKEHLPKDSPECTNLELNKRARNITQQINDANGTTANAGDTIEYTLSVKNTADVIRKAFVMEENIGDVLEYADIIDYGGATLSSNPVPMLTWAPIDIKPGETVSRTILVKIKSPIPSTPSAASDPSSFDMKIANTYGDSVVINLPNQPVKVVEQTITALPSTGFGTNVIVSTVLLAAASYFYFRSRLMLKETRLVKQEFNHSMGV